MMHKQNLYALAAAAGLLVLIFDSGLALEGAAAGVELCIKTVIPSLFPFFLLSMVLTRYLQEGNYRGIHWISDKLGMSPAAAPALIPAFLGGYPVGAKCVGDLYAGEKISKKEAERLLSFCSNAGPSFLFGMVSGFFTDLKMVWLLWLIQIAAAVLTAFVFPGEMRVESLQNKESREKGKIDIMWSASKAMGTVCGWIILFRTILAFGKNWFLWLFPQWLQVLLSGVLELSNGCCELKLISDVAVRFVICGCMLSFGGICVLLQTMSVTEGLSLKGYILGKLVQTGFCFLLSWAVMAQNRLIFAAAVPIVLVFLRKNRKRYGNHGAIPV